MTRLSVLFLILCWHMMAYTQPLPAVVTSIQPLAAIVYPLCDGVCEVQHLQDAQRSAHDFHLSPQHLKQLHHARMILWFDAHLEGATFEKVALDQGDHAKLIHIQSLPLSWRAIRQLKVWGDGDDHHDHHDHDHDHDHGDIDPHFWLDPIMAAEMVKQVSQQLQELWPEQREIIQRNTQRWLADLKQLDRDIQAELSEVSDVPFLVFHDAYQYFEKRYHLNTRGVIQLNPHVPDSAKARWDVHHQLISENIRHVFIEPQLNGQWIKRRQDIHVGTLDPLGANLSLNRTTYQRLLMHLTQSLVETLSKTDHDAPN